MSDNGDHFDESNDREMVALMSAFKSAARQPSDDVAARSRDSFLQHVEQQRRDTGGEFRSRGALLGMAVLAAGLSLIVSVALLRQAHVEPLNAAPLDYVLSDPAARKSDDRIVTESQSVDLTFTDETSVGLSEYSELLIAQRDERGADLRLVRGAISLNVVPRENARWSVVAGRVVVDVTGTSFNVAHLPDGETVVELFEGGVTLRGSAFAEELELAPGQRFVLKNGLGSWSVGPIAEASESPDSAGGTDEGPTDVAAGHAEAGRVEQDLTPDESWGQDPAQSDERANSTGARAGPQKRDPPELDWSKLIELGKYDRVLQDAKRKGIENVLERGRLRDLVALSDAARYVGERQVATKALEAQIAKAPESRHGKDAMFLLGRLAEDQRDLRKALTWYDNYIERVADGRFSENAHGRRMVLLERLGHLVEARKASNLYLERFPGGSHAPIARRISESAPEPSP